MKQIICLSLGQAGIQLGNSCWELLCLQHGISPEGYKLKRDQDCQNKLDESKDPLFMETESGKYVPRNLMIDLQPSVVDQIRVGPYKQLFHPGNLISGKQGASCNYTRGYYAVGQKVIQQVLEKVRKISQKCQQFQGFMFFHALGGGTGSGFSSLLTEKLSYNFGKKSKMNFTIYPSPNVSNSIVQPYNAVLSTYALIQHTDINIMIDNQALYDICRRNLDIQCPEYRNLNRIIAQNVQSVTQTLRFDGSRNLNIDQFYTNLVPYPRIHFLLSSYAPFVPAQKQYLQRFSVRELTNQAFSPRNMMAKCDPIQGKYISCSLNYRGDIIEKDINTALRGIKQKKTVEFVDWVPASFGMGINSQPPVVVARGDLAKTQTACSMLSNTTVVRQIFKRMNRKFHRMYSKRAFVHWYTGYSLQQFDFLEASQSLAYLTKDYQQVECLSNEEEN